MATKDDIIARQAKQIADLIDRVSELELQLAKAMKDSSNSSKSPSSDIVKPPKKQTDRRKKAKRGGQKGHPRKLRKLLPPERVDEEILYEIPAAEVRELGLTSTDQFEIVQYVELLDLPIHVTEHQLREYVNSHGEIFLPHVPELRNQPVFGLRMLAMVGWLKSRAHCSYTTIEAWMEDILQGTRSVAGQRYHERMWTAIATCAKQGHSFFDFLHQSIEAKLEGQPAPSLLTD